MSRSGVDDLRPVYISEYEITTEPIQDRAYKRLPSSVKDRIDRLHYESQSKPQQAIPELLELLEKYPRLPILYNFLSVAYSLTGQIEKAEEVIKDNYRRNPNYLFAKLNYAEIHLVKGDYDAVAEILDHKFDLKQLYPKRNRFHVSEVVNFMGVVGVYFEGIGEREAAETCYEILQQLEPGHQLTKRLRRRLYPGPITRFLRWLKKDE